MKRALIVLIVIMSTISCTRNSTDYTEKQIHEHDSIKSYEINITYPLLRNNELNAIIQSDIDSNILHFKSFIADFEGYSTRNLDYSYKIITYNNKTISIAQTFQWAVPGVERILYFHRNLNYDFVNRKKIEASNLFSLNYIDTLRAISIDALKREINCSLDSTESFKSFYFSRDSIFFNLNLLEIDCDDFTLAIEKNRLKNILIKL